MIKNMLVVEMLVVVAVPDTCLRCTHQGCVVGLALGIVGVVAGLCEVIYKGFTKKHN